MTHDPRPADNFSKNDAREIFGWSMYDWANSAFSTTIVGALFGPYLTRLAQDAVGENGIVLSFGLLGAVTAKSLSTFAVGCDPAARLQPTASARAMGNNINEIRFLII